MHVCVPVCMCVCVHVWCVGAYVCGVCVCVLHACVCRVCLHGCSVHTKLKVMFTGFCSRTGERPCVPPT